MRINHLKILLPEVGIDAARVAMYNLSAAMGPKWAEICTEFTGVVKKLGPSPIWFANRKHTGKI